mmetsp:Transcript_27297/g.55868  ORF Transcript_27297/g.55868 Transcript_27297/m.55868 type:complete len:221 (-) Transcript_27297:408-1070(-)
MPLESEREITMLLRNLAADLNDSGVYLMERGDFDLASMTFMDAALMMNRAFCADFSCSDLLDESDKAFKCAQRVMERLNSKDDDPNERRSEHLRNYSPPMDLPVDPNELFSVCDLSAIITYNLALSFHVRGDIAGNTDFLVKSLSWYDLAVSLLKTEGDANDENMSIIQCRHRLAATCLSNASKVQSALGRQDAAETLLKKSMLRLSMAVLSSPVSSPAA